MTKTKKIKGWPDTDPYPYRNQDEWPPLDKGESDCGFVKNEKEAVASWVDDNEEPDYKYHLGIAWKKINSMHEELQQAKDNIKWLENVGGEKLNMACGIDIFCRSLILAKKKESATSSTQSC